MTYLQKCLENKAFQYYAFGALKRETATCKLVFILNISVLYSHFGRHLILWLSTVINLMILMVCEADKWSVSLNKQTCSFEDYPGL